MGGRCWFVIQQGNSANGEGERRERAPPCTDNFQYVAFQYKGKQWMSVEQCFQAQKFHDDGIQERIRLCLKKSETETDHEHGMRVWSEGRRYSKIRGDWDKVKVDEMFNICWAKLESNPKMQIELVEATGGSYPIEGNSSTGWDHPKLGHQNWSFWNGLIQMKCRELCKPVEKRNAQFLMETDEMFKKYREGYP
jgi:predicted NAD-dependent protein-ADP-ribosyltransferase YbiA (DUF1768 family)